MRPKPRFAQLVFILIWLGISPAHAAPLVLPSGNSAELIEAMWDDSAGAGTDLRLRFLTPDLDPDTTFEDIEIDLAVLCDAIALPILAETGREVGQIVISISDRPVPFGKTDLKATQHFDTFRPEDGACVWDGL
ncbi:MAG: acetolactate synthase [Rhodobacteraceae bacterium]|nr:acetolactate synthase [Paracoccaceae bacterium]